MKKNALPALFEQCIREKGTATVEKALSSLLESPQSVLTIVANSGVHSIPPQYLRGEIYSASSGNFDISTQNGIESIFKKILQDLGKKLREQSWRKIYLIPTGHPTLSMQIKSFVYRVTRLNTVDLFYANGHYHDISIDHREILLVD